MEALSRAAYAAYMGGCTLHNVEDEAATAACSVCQEVAAWEKAQEDEDEDDWEAAIREAFRVPLTLEKCAPLRYDAVPGNPVEVGDFRVYYDGSLLEGRDNFAVRVRFAGPSAAGRVLWDKLAADAQ
jgi:hypothetical protein